MAASFPTKTDFVNGDVLVAGDLNQIGENVNDLDVRVITQELLFAAGRPIQEGDAGKLLVTTGTAAVNVTIPDRLVHNFEPGQRFDVVQGTEFLVNIQSVAEEPADFELLGKGASASPTYAFKLDNQYSACTLIYLFANTWLIVGDIEEV